MSTRHLLLLIITVSLMTSATPAAWAQPLSRTVEIHHPLGDVYAALSNYFSPDSMHDFQVVSHRRTKSKAEFVAKRTVQDQMKWSEWAYCKLPSLQMLATLQQGNITVTVELERESADRTYATVTPAFEGVYALADNTTTRQCTSKGILEKDILRAAGAAETDLN